MKKKLLVLGMVLIALLSLIGLTACTKDKEDASVDVEFTIGYTNLNVSYMDEHDLKSMVKTLDEWESVYSTREYLLSLNDKYTEQFFADNSLIVYAFTKGWGINKAEIIKLANNGNELSVGTNIELNIMEVMSQGILIIEVAKSDVASITSLRID